MAPKRAATAYFLFAEENRAAVRQELQDAASDGQKLSVADVGKALGDKWRSLSDEEKEKYKVLAQKKTEELRAQAAAEPEDAAEDATPKQDDNQSSLSLPIGTVKKIMMLDKEVSRASAECVRTIALATEVFLGMLGSKCAQVAKSNKRRTVQLKDFEQAVRYDKRLVAAGLKEVVQVVQQKSASADKPASKKQKPDAQAGDKHQAPTTETAAADAEMTEASPAGAPPAAGSPAADAPDTAGKSADASGKENNVQPKAKSAKRPKSAEPPAKNHSIMTFFARSSAGAAK